MTIPHNCTDVDRILIAHARTSRAYARAYSHHMMADHKGQSRACAAGCLTFATFVEPAMLAWRDARQALDRYAGALLEELERPRDPTCPTCGEEHAPIDPAKRYAYATRPGSPAHASEVSWFARHGVIPHGLRPIEAYCEAAKTQKETKR